MERSKANRFPTAGCTRILSSVKTAVHAWMIMGRGSNSHSKQFLSLTCEHVGGKYILIYWAFFLLSRALLIEGFEKVEHSWASLFWPQPNNTAGILQGIWLWGTWPKESCLSKQGSVRGILGLDPHPPPIWLYLQWFVQQQIWTIRQWN